MVAPPTLPFSPSLDIAALSAAFRDTATSYKFLWMQALLRVIERDEFTEVESENPSEHSGGVVPMPLLVAHMLDIAKYPLRRFHLSFGAQDKVLDALRDLEDAEGWHELAGTLSEREIAERHREIPLFVHRRLTRFVPYRFLTPFYGDEVRGLNADAAHDKIIRLANAGFESRHPPFYRFSKDGADIEIHRDWKNYMREHMEILQGWTLWHWGNYLQKRNPNIPAVSGKLAKPVSEDLGMQRRFWRWVVGKRAGEIRCIYSGEVLRAQNFAVDHYVPWDFIGHDNLWNLIPAKPEANSAKSNLLPVGDYLPEFVRTQHIALSAFCASGRTEWNPLMESYLVDLHLREMPAVGKPAPALEDLESAYSRIIPPLLQLAENCGFRRMAKTPNDGSATQR